jgi:hypothetical protein
MEQLGSHWTDFYQILYLNIFRKFVLKIHVLSKSENNNGDSTRRPLFVCDNISPNSNKSPTRCNNFPVYYPDVYLQLNMFRAFSRPSSGAQLLQWQPMVLPSYRCDSRAVFVVGPAGRPGGRPARPRTQHDCHHDTKVKPEAATAVTELLTMGGKTPETC